MRRRNRPDRRGRGARTARAVALRAARWALRAARVTAFAGYFGRELVAATAAVAWTVVSPRCAVSPGIVEVPLASRTDRDLALLAGLLSLVPGMMPLAVRRDPPALWMHGLRVDDRDTLRRQVRTFEERMLRAFGGRGGRWG